MDKTTESVTRGTSKEITEEITRIGNEEGMTETKDTIETKVGLCIRDLKKLKELMNHHTSPTRNQSKTESETQEPRTRQRQHSSTFSNQPKAKRKRSPTDPKATDTRLTMETTAMPPITPGTEDTRGRPTN